MSSPEDWTLEDNADGPSDDNTLENGGPTDLQEPTFLDWMDDLGVPLSLFVPLFMTLLLTC